MIGNQVLASLLRILVIRRRFNLVDPNLIPNDPASKALVLRLVALFVFPPHMHHRLHGGVDDTGLVNQLDGVGAVLLGSVSSRSLTVRSSLSTKVKVA